jgi:predicted GIY-YIG superfamily endonuclease
MDKNFYVYEVVVNGNRRYVGFTNNIKRRKKQHFKGINSDDKKALYVAIRELKTPQIDINVIGVFEKSVEAKRWEAHLVLLDYFSDKMLWQSIPTTFKYF